MSVMKNMNAVLILLVITTSIPFSSALAGEKEVLKALEELKGSLGAGVSYNRYRELMDEAEIQIDTIKGNKNRNTCFIENIEYCFYLYNLPMSLWQKRITFEIGVEDFDQHEYWGLAEKHIDKAYECLKKADTS